MKWKTKDDKVLELFEMELNHLINCKKLLEKQLEEVSSATAYPPVMQGEMAQYYAEQEYEICLEEEENLIKKIKEFKKEIKKRLTNKN